MNGLPKVVGNELRGAKVSLLAPHNSSLAGVGITYCVVVTNTILKHILTS